MLKIYQIIVPVMVAGTLFGCGTKDDAGAASNLHSVYVTVPQGGPMSASQTYTSTVEEGKSVNASFKTGGQIRRLTVNEGDYVSKGQVIGWLDDADYRLSVRQLEAQYEQMTSEMKRLDEMMRRNNIAANDYEKARAGLEQVRTQLEMTRNKLAYTRLEAPSSGYVVERFMEEGEMAGAGTPVYKILDNSSLETSVALPASVYSRKADIASCVGISAVTGEQEIPLEVISFVPDGDNNSLFRLRLRIPASMKQTLLPGMSMSVKLNFRTADGAATSLIPSRALFERGGKEYVWVVNPADSTLSARQVTVEGSHTGDRCAVSGLTGDEIVVAAGVHHLNDKEKVNIIGDIKALK